MSDEPSQRDSAPDAPATRDDANAFPRLDDDQIKQIARFGNERDLDSGTLIFERGQREVDFYVILKGRCEILDDSGLPGPTQDAPVVHVHGERGFTGELDLFSSRKILVSGRIVTDDGSPGRVLCVPRGKFARMLSAEPEIGQIIIRAFILRRLGLVDHSQGGVLLVGRRDSADALRLERFLKRNGYPMRALHVDNPDEADEADGILRQFKAGHDDLPVVVCSHDALLKKPSNADLASCLGLTEEPKPGRCYDVAVVGGGPAGLAAAVYAASEGLGTIIIEGEAPGGQAGTSSRIENYLGFPTGVSGWELAARGQHQAQKFGATLSVPRQATKLEPCDGGGDGYKLHLDHGPPVRCRSVIVACGARWRTLDLDNAGKFEGSGIHYAATAVEADLCGDKEVAVVGGGNSAGQAAVFLSGRAKKVHMLVRGKGLADSMSDYLVKRIEASEEIELLCDTSIVGLEGDEWLRKVAWKTGDGEAVTRDVEHVFLMIGAVPHSEWLEGTLRRDGRGFVQTGAGVTDGDCGDGCRPWKLDRPPHALEASLPGVFAVGDVRSGSVKRVASAVGEGSVCVADVPPRAGRAAGRGQMDARRRGLVDLLSKPGRNAAQVWGLAWLYVCRIADRSRPEPRCGPA